MKYYLSTIADVTEEAGGDDLGKLVYTEKTAEMHLLCYVRKALDA